MILQMIIVLGHRLTDTTNRIILYPIPQVIRLPVEDPVLATMTEDQIHLAVHDAFQLLVGLDGKWRVRPCRQLRQPVGGKLRQREVELQLAQPILPTDLRQLQILTRNDDGFHNLPQHVLHLTDEGLRLTARQSLDGLLDHAIPLSRPAKVDPLEDVVDQVPSMRPAFDGAEYKLIVGRFKTIRLGRRCWHVLGTEAGITRSTPQPLQQVGIKGWRLRIYTLYRL